MISKEKNFIFIHVPKTAGNTLQVVLSKYSEDRLVSKLPDGGLDRFEIASDYVTHKHATLNDYFVALGSEAFWTMKRFTCVRNPWERMISFYFSPHRKCDTWDRDQFIEFLDSVRPITDFLTLDAENKLPIVKNLDFILRYESLDLDFARACIQLEIPYEPLPTFNKSARKNYQHYYDKELIEIVRSRFLCDIELFGYEYGS